MSILEPRERGRPGRRPRAQGVLVAALLLGCASTAAPRAGGEPLPGDGPAAHDPAPGVHEEPVEGTEATAPRRRAADARVAAEQSGERVPRLFDSAEFRVSERPEDDLLAGEGTRLALQLQLLSPWETAARVRARRAATGEAEARRQATALEGRAEACEAGVALGAHALRLEAYARYAAEAEALLDWLAALREAGVIDEAAAARLEMDVRTRLTTRAPRRPAWSGIAPVDLPEPEAPPAGVLDARPQVVRRMIAAHHPDPKALQAAADRFAAEAEASRAAAFPWVRRVRLSYDLPHGRRAEGWGGQVAVRFPFGTDERSQAERLRALARAERFEASARVAEQGRLATAALEALAAFEAGGERWDQLEALARRSEDVAGRLLAAQEGEPGTISGLLTDAHRAREAVIEARERAGLAACALLATTGVDWSRWPREETER